jgi:hypothetical protein
MEAIPFNDRQVAAHKVNLYPWARSARIEIGLIVSRDPKTFVASIIKICDHAVAYREGSRHSFGDEWPSLWFTLNSTTH